MSLRSRSRVSRLQYGDSSTTEPLLSTTSGIMPATSGIMPTTSGITSTTIVVTPTTTTTTTRDDERHVEQTNDQSNAQLNDQLKSVDNNGVYPYLPGKQSPKELSLSNSNRAKDDTTNNLDTEARFQLLFEMISNLSKQLNEKNKTSTKRSFEKVQENESENGESTRKSPKLNEKKEEEVNRNRNFVNFKPQVPSKFNGDGDYEAWWSEMSAYLELFGEINDKERVICINSFISGQARLILDVERANRTMSVRDIHLFLRKLFVAKTNKFAQCIDTIQMPGEDSQKFANRLRLVMIKALAGTKNLNSKMVDNDTLSVFLRNTLPEIRERLNLVLPSTIENAVKLARQYELEEEEKKLTKNKCKIKTEHVFELEDESKETRSFLEKRFNKLHEKIASMQATVLNKKNPDESIDKIKVIYEKINSSDNKTSQKPPIKCYFCGKFYHTFENCWKATERDKIDIREKMNSKNST
jgi:hypothetical protein